MVHRPGRTHHPGRLWPWDEMELMLEHIFRWPHERRPPAWKPDVDIFEREEEYVIFVDVPGLEAEQIDLSLYGNTLTVQGDRPSPPSAQGVWHAQERPYGRFERRVSLPEPVDPRGVDARCKNGVLEVRVRKSRR